MDAQMNGILAEINDRLANAWELAEDADPEIDDDDDDEALTLEDFFGAMVETLIEEYDADEDFKQLQLEDKELKPLQPQVPGTFDPTAPAGAPNSASPNATKEDKSGNPKASDDKPSKSED